MNARLATHLPHCMLVLLLGAPSFTQAWTGALPQGGELRVDPDTHRAWRVEETRLADVPQSVRFHPAPELTPEAVAAITEQVRVGCCADSPAAG
jgi:hypothetical protein